MGYIDYSLEPESDIAFIDMKSFYASVECVERGLNPLKACLCVLSRSDNTNGLILAASPTFKKIFGKSNVGRTYDLPFNIKTRKFDYYKAKKAGLPTDNNYKNYIEYWANQALFVPPRMRLYIKKNVEILNIFEKYTTKKEIVAYSIDEAFIDLTDSLNHLVKNINLSRRDKLDIVSRDIQIDILKNTGIYATVGMSNSNPLLAKLALDNEAKKSNNMRANWSYEDVESKVWGIKNITDFWGISTNTKKRLNKLKIYTVKDLANANPDILKKEFGVIGVQLWFHANGVDESSVLEPYKTKNKGFGNSQILPKNYYDQKDIELVLSEVAEQVSIRLNKAKKKASIVGIYVGYAYEENEKSIKASLKIDPTNSTKRLTNYVIYLFRKKYKENKSVRSIGVRYTGLINDDYVYYNLFEDPMKIEKEERLDRAIALIRDKYGFLSLQKANSLLSSSRVVERNKLIGGHSANGL